MAQTKSKRVIIVGGGISGMVAAYELQKNGVDVLLLEKNSQLGGRVSARNLDGIPYDLGAQMLPGRSPYMLNLIKEIGLNQQLVEVSSGVALARDGRLYQAQLNSPASLLSSGYLKVWELLNVKGLMNLMSMLQSANRPLADITGWKDLDNETVSQWSKRSGLDSLKEWILEPLLSPIFGRAETTSKSTLFWIYDYVSNSSKIYSLKEGLGTIAESLSQKIPHKVNVTVEKILEDGEKVIVQTSEGQYLADYVIIATTAPAAKALLNSDNCAYDKKLLEDTRYYTTIVLNIKTDRNWMDIAQLVNTYSILIPKSESAEIGTIALASAFGNRLINTNSNMFQVYFRDEIFKIKFKNF